MFLYKNTYGTKVKNTDKKSALKNHYSAKTLNNNKILLVKLLLNMLIAACLEE